MKLALAPDSQLLTRAGSRRQFLSAGSAVMVTSLAWPWGSLAAQRRFAMKERSLDELRLATFAEVLNSRFQVTDGAAGGVALRLLEASADKISPHHRPDAPDAHHEKFSLLFSGPTEPLLAQRIYRFEHPRIGWFEMFIVPIVTREEDQQNYQAIFNRPIHAK